ncbi:MAG: hypothetical protein PGN16_19685 [Sphingomonas phyllosphaerae]|uniref:hypothetical protein n=1 Tax=Sphingomonas phyllosphaerae TaxID=257003 RepID=UPI002FFAB8E4
MAVNDSFTPPDRTGSLAGKRILFFSVRYFGYEQQIISELLRRGAEVDFLPDRPFNTPLMNALSRYARGIVLIFATRFYRNRLKNLENKAYDLVFVINGQTLSKELLSEWRLKMPKARFLFYIWDSMRNKPKAHEILRYFDECITFDPEASKRFGMRLLPLFFARGFENTDQEATYDISFVGTAHSDRHRVISRIDQSLPADIRRFWYPFLQARWVFYIQKIINPAFRAAKFEDFRYDPLPFKRVQEIFVKSRTIVDIEHPHQTGLTMRTFEALGARKKLITTNASVKDYDFYHPDNFYILDRKKSIRAAFIHKK